MWWTTLAAGAALQPRHAAKDLEHHIYLYVIICNNVSMLSVPNCPAVCEGDGPARRLQSIKSLPMLHKSVNHILDSRLIRDSKTHVCQSPRSTAMVHCRWMLL